MWRPVVATTSPSVTFMIRPWTQPESPSVRMRKTASDSRSAKLPQPERGARGHQLQDRARFVVHGLWRMGGSVASWVSAADEIGLNWSVVAFLVVLTLLLLGLGGLVILVCAMVVGLVPLVFKVRRAQLMGFFLVPTMLFYSGQQGRVVDWLSLEQRTAPLLPSVTLSGITLAVLVSGASVIKCW